MDQPFPSKTQAINAMDMNSISNEHYKHLSATMDSLGIGEILDPDAKESKWGAL